MKFIENNLIPIIFSTVVLVIVILSTFLEVLSSKYLILSSIFSIITIFLIIAFEYADIVYLFKNLQIFLIFSVLFFLVFLFSAIPEVFEFPTGGIRSVALFFLIIFALVLLDRSKNKFRFTNNKFEKILLFFIILSFFISTLIFNYPNYIDYEGGPGLLVFILSPYVLFYYFIRKMINEKVVYDYFTLLVYVLGFTSSVFGIITVFIPELNPLNNLPGYSISFFQHPNAHSFLYGYSIPVTIYLFLKYKDVLKNSHRIFLILSFLLMLMNQILTLSRSGSVALLFCIFVFMVFYSRKLFVLFLALLPLVIYYIFQFTTEKGAGTLLGRVGLLFSAFEMISSSKEGMLWGFGITSYSPIYESFKSSLWVSDIHNYPHNTIVFSVLRFGLINTFFIVMYIIYQLGIALKNLFGKKITLEYALSLSVCLSVLVQSLLEDFIAFPEYYLFHYFLIFFGLLVYYNKENGNHRFSLKINYND